MKYSDLPLTTAKYWDYLVDNEICSEETLKVVTSINGYNIDTLKDVLFATTGYRDLAQLENA